MLKIPEILNSNAFINAPLNYKWESKSSTFYYVDAHNENIGKALWSLNHKATLGVATALCEWIFWRLSKHVENGVVNQSLEAQWAGLIDKHYFVDWEYNENYISESIEGPLWVMLKCIQYPREAYINGHVFINKKVPNLAMLARHISPDVTLFDNWFSHILKKAAELFPAQYDYAEILFDLKDREGEIYDSTTEPAIPRDFFWELDYDFNNSNNDKIINEFLKSLDYENSPFLVLPEDMIEEGFEGEPYNYKD